VIFIQYGPVVTWAQMMVASCKRFGYEVWQLSDEISPKVEGVDVLKREPMRGGRMMYRAQRLADQEAPYVLLDTDMIVAKDISDGFSEDVSLSWRPKQNVMMKDGPPIRMPYNGGLVFVSNAAFMRDCYEEMKKMPPKHQDWYGDQIALRDVAESGKYKVRELKESGWNYVPEQLGEMRPDIRIYHFKGLRKQMMPHYFKVLS
jgi:hypothetical protein